MKLLILGSGGYGRVVADVALQTNKYSEILFLDDKNRTTDVYGQCCEFKRYINNDTQFYPAFGNNQLRLDWLDRLIQAKAEIATIIHMSAYVSPTSQIGCGTVVLPHAAVGSYTKIGTGSIINMGAAIDHNCVIGKGAHICLGAIVKADNCIPECFKVEAGQIIENGMYR